MSTEVIAPVDQAPRRKRRWPWVIVFSIVILLLVAAIAGVLYTTSLARSYDTAEKLPDAEVFPTAPRPVAPNPEAMNLLLLGSDTRGELGEELDEIRGQRSDTIMLVHIPADREGAQVISIMRDNWVEIPGRGMHKINAALAFGGVPLLVETIESILDVPIDHVAIIDFDGFIGLSEALDGVTLHNDIAFRSRGYEYASGEITVQGEEALQYVRARYNFPDGDYQRVRNQQAFVKGAVAKLISRETLTNPVRISESVKALSPYLKVSSGLSPHVLVSLGLDMRDVRPGDITFFTSPTLGTGTAGSQSIVRPDWDGLAALSEALKNDTVEEFAKTVTR